jgi:hypothetical protein
MRRGRETDYQQSGLGVAKRGNRATPVFLISIGSAPLNRDALAVFAKAWAALAGDHFAFQDFELPAHGNDGLTVRY